MAPISPPSESDPIGNPGRRQPGKDSPVKSPPGSRPEDDGPRDPDSVDKRPPITEFPGRQPDIVPDPEPPPLQH